MIFLTVEEFLHVAERTLGAPAEIRDIGLLESAVARPAVSVRGVDAYPSLAAKASALVHSLVRNHALIDGNKRLGLMGLVVFLGVNGATLTFTNDDAYDFIVEIAEGHLDDVSVISDGLQRAIG
jgi:death on curing protein